MDYAWNDEEQRLRHELRSLAEEWFGDGFPGIFVEDEGVVQQTLDFCSELARRGLLTISWPREYGGQEASVWSQTVVKEEMWGSNEPRGPQYMNLNWVGPAIMAFGTEAQKQQHLPPIAAGSVIWCQGFSEPEAGSDLASLRLRATPNEHGFVLNGQKLWTSYADLAQWCVLGARTDNSGPKQHGITVFLVPTDRAGVEVRSIDSILGPHHFNEVFFTDVQVVPEDVLGSVDDGWRVMTSALQFERAGIARYARSARILADVCEAVASGSVNYGRIDRRRLARAVVHTRAAQLLYYRVVADAESGAPEGGLASMSRILNTTLEQEVASLAMDAVGPRALLDHRDAGAVAGGHFEHHWRYSLAATVAAGTLEIQKMIVARGLVK